jgi:hypothetical protein
MRHRYGVSPDEVELFLIGSMITLVVAGLAFLV